MSDFVPHGKETAPEPSRPLLAKAQKTMGFIPNLLGVLAESPAALEAYLTLSDIYKRSAFSPEEQQLLLIAISAANGCTYCVPAHTAAAKRTTALPAEVIEAVRDGGPIADRRLAALRAFAVAVVEKRGRIGDPEVQEFLAAGYGKAHVLDVLVAVALKTLSNYTNHIAEVPLDEAFEAERWRPPASTKAA